MAKCMLLDAGLSLQYWGEAVMTAVYLQNRLPTKATNKTPFELWNGEKPDLSHIRIFGCKAFAYVPKEKRTKFDDRATEAVLVGYSERSKGYRLLQTDTNKIIVSRSVTFVESEINDDVKTEQQMINHNVTGEKPMTGEKSLTDEKPQLATNQNKVVEIHMPTENNQNIDDKVEDIHHNVEFKPDIDQPRQSARSNKGIPPKRLSLLVQNEVKNEPASWNEMKLLPDDEQKNWIKAAEEEMRAHDENKTWILCDLPADKKAIDCKWVFKLKHNAEGNVYRYKARLVARGFVQKFGEDFDDTFSPVARHTTLRTLLTIAASKKMQVNHYDVKTAFLNGDN